MDVSQVRSELDKTLAAIGRQDNREARLLRELEAVRAYRDRLDAEVQAIVKQAERADSEPQQHGMLFGLVEPELAAAIGRRAQ